MYYVQIFVYWLHMKKAQQYVHTKLDQIHPYIQRLESIYALLSTGQMHIATWFYDNKNTRKQIDSLYKTLTTATNQLTIDTHSKQNIENCKNYIDMIQKDIDTILNPSPIVYWHNNMKSIDTTTRIRESIKETVSSINNVYDYARKIHLLQSKTVDKPIDEIQALIDNAAENIKYFDQLYRSHPIRSLFWNGKKDIIKDINTCFFLGVVPIITVSIKHIHHMKDRIEADIQSFYQPNWRWHHKVFDVYWQYLETLEYDIGEYVEHILYYMPQCDHHKIYEDFLRAIDDCKTMKKMYDKLTMPFKPNLQPYAKSQYTWYQRYRKF